MDKNIGRITEAEARMMNQEWLNAQEIMDSLNPNNSMESNFRNYFGIVSNKFINSNYQFTSGEISGLQEIASQCPKSGGIAVLLAQSYLKTVLFDFDDYENDCNSENSQRKINPQTKNDVFLNLNYSIYPNPVSDVLTINLPDVGSVVLIVLDSQGRKMLETKLSAGQNKISFGNLDAGIYQYKLILNTEQKTGKLTVIK